jgi:hypothetical protein
MKQAVHGGHVGEKLDAYRFFTKLEEKRRDNMENKGVEVMTVLKWIINIMAGCKWNDLAHNRDKR